MNQRMRSIVARFRAIAHTKTGLFLIVCLPTLAISGASVSAFGPHDAAWVNTYVYWTAPEVLNPPNRSDASYTVADVWEQNCSDLYAANYNDGTLSNREKVNGSAYDLHTWVTLQGDANNNQNATIITGQSLALQINQMKFICAIVTMDPLGLPPPNGPVYGTHKVTHKNYPNERAPVPDNAAAQYKINQVSLFESNTLISAAKFQILDPSNGYAVLQSGSVPSAVGDTLGYKRDPNSRYWRDPSPALFNLQPSPDLNPGTYILELTIDAWTMNTYHDFGAAGVTKCELYASNQDATVPYPSDKTKFYYPSTTEAGNNWCKKRTPSLRFVFTVKPAWTLTGVSRVTTPTNPTQTLSSTLGVGETALFHHYVRNNGPKTADYTWQTYGQLGGGAQFKVPAGHAAVFVPGTPAGTSDPSNFTTGGFTFPAGTPNGTKYCEHIEYTHANGPQAGQPNGSSPLSCVTYKPKPVLPVDCAGYTLSQSLVEAGTPFDVTNAKVQYANAGAANSALSTGGKYFVKVTVQNPDGSDGAQVFNDIVASQNNAGLLDLASPDTNKGPLAAGSYNIYWGVQGGADDKVCSDQFDVGAKPYFTLRGGDISAGAWTDAATSAQNAESDAGIQSWNDDAQGGSGNTFGAGSQVAAFALSNIKSFITGLNPDNNTSVPLASRAAGNALQAPAVFSAHMHAFANTGTGVTVDDAGNYGGQFANLPSPTNYYSLVNTGSSSWSDDLTTSGTYNNLTGTQTISGNQTLPPNTVVTLRVNGDVIIKGNILYDDSGGPLHYPRLNIFATGSIYILGGASGPTEIHGLFAAQGPNSVFATCADIDSTTGDGVERVGYDFCNHQLKIYGAVTTTKLHLNRTWGSLSDTSKGSAEEFIFGPELWLGTPDCAVNTGDKICSPTGAPAYQSFTGLPPIL